MVGGSLIIIAFLIDRLGYGDPGNFGVGQFLLVIVGLVVFLTGLLGKRIVNFYRGVALILLNTFVLLACLELGAIIVARSFQQVKSAEIQNLPYYAAQDWTQVYWQEAKLAENYAYEPYTIWRHRPFVGQTVNINQDGIRQTPGAECQVGAYKVFTFGGSTMLGWGSPDWGTIAAYLQTGLADRRKGPVCVVNLAEDGFVSTQSLVALMLQLQSGNIPDTVIFYDGVNDVLAAYESGQPGSHVTLAKIASKYENPEHPLIQWFKSSRQYALVENLVQKLQRNGQENGQRLPKYQTVEIDADYLADSVTEVYLSNYEIMGALAQEYGFEYFFFLQPHLAVDKKALTQEEQIIKSRMDPALARLAKAVYENIALAATNYENLWYIANVFDEEETQIWFDEWGHVTPEGNRLVAWEMLAVIESKLAENDY